MGLSDSRVQGPSVPFCANESNPEANRTSRASERIQLRIMFFDLAKPGIRESLAMVKVN